jgi:mono/diheme cytochrome c family protein
MRRARWTLTLATAIIGASAVTVSNSSPGLAAASPAFQAGSKPVPSSEASIKAGATIYQRACRDCHGLRGRGDGITAPPGSKPANLTDAEWKHGGTDAEIFKTIKEGIAPYEHMKPLGKVFPDNDIWHLVNYIRSLAAPAKK